MKVVAAKLKDGTLIKEGLKILKNMGNNFLYVYNGRKAGKVELDETAVCPSDLERGYYMVESEKYLNIKQEAEQKEKDEQEKIENTPPIVLEEQRKREEQRQIEEAKQEAERLLAEMKENEAKEVKTEKVELKTEEITIDATEEEVVEEEVVEEEVVEEEVVEEVVEPKFIQLTAEQLKEDYTIKEIKAEAEKRGYDIEKTRKDDIIEEFLAQQK